MEAPKADRIDHVTIVHGQQRNDPYYWLREKNNEKVIDYIKKGLYFNFYQISCQH